MFSFSCLLFEMATWAKRSSLVPSNKKKNPTLRGVYGKRVCARCLRFAIQWHTHAIVFFILARQPVKRIPCADGNRPEKKTKKHSSLSFPSSLPDGKILLVSRIFTIQKESTESFHLMCACVLFLFFFLSPNFDSFVAGMREMNVFDWLNEREREIERDDSLPSPRYSTPTTYVHT